MTKIDTEYESLADVPPAVAQYYSEETRTRVVGYEEPDEEGYSKPITEPYTVVVLNRPDTVLYSDVAQRIGERKSRDVVNAELARAIEWEEFYYGFNLTNAYNVSRAGWEASEPQSLDYTDDLAFEEAHKEWQEGEPKMPVIDLGVRREYYYELGTGVDHNVETVVGVELSYDDEKFTTLATSITEPKEPSVISAYHSDLAIETRYNAVYAPLPVGDAFMDMGRGKDTVLGIDNVKDTIMGYDAGMTSTDSVMWIMTDNSVKEMTIDDLRKVLVGFNSRKQIVFMQYGAWRETDRQSPFTHQPG